jgi:cytoskeletal protein CcmA (bactofilin family)
MQINDSNGVATPAPAPQPATDSLVPGAPGQAMATVSQQGHAASADAVKITLPPDAFVVPSSVRMRGAVEVPGAVVLDGVIEGDLTAGGHIVLRAGSRVIGTVRGKGDVTVAGTIEASSNDSPTLVCHGKLTVAGTAKVTGAVEYARIAIHEGGLVSGRLEAIRS